MTNPIIHSGRYIAGIDVGTRMTKCVVFDTLSGTFTGRVTQLTGHNLAASSEKVLADACVSAGIAGTDVFYVASTGFGRYQVPMRQIQITDISCHATGAKYLFPNTNAVLDVGAQNAKAMHIGDDGRVKKFKMNDKCA